MTDTPFLVLGLPRSRTFWCSRYLSAFGRRVDHDILIDMTTLDDLPKYFDRPGAAAVDTTLGLVWEGVVGLLPDVRLAVITRPVEAVIRSFAHLGMTGEEFEAWLRKYATHLDALVATGRCHVTQYDALATDDGAGELFEYCHGRPADPARWRRYNRHNIQNDVRDTVKRVAARGPELTALLGSLGEVKGTHAIH